MLTDSRLTSENGGSAHFIIRNKSRWGWNQEMMMRMTKRGAGLNQTPWEELGPTHLRRHYNHHHHLRPHHLSFRSDFNPRHPPFFSWLFLLILPHYFFLLMMMVYHSLFHLLQSMSTKTETCDKKIYFCQSVGVKLCHFAKRHATHLLILPLLFSSLHVPCINASNDR